MATLAAALTFTVANVAQAGNFGSVAARDADGIGLQPTTSVDLGNDSVHPVSFNLASTAGRFHLPPVLEEGVRFAIANVYNPTDLNMFTTGGENDTIIFEDDYGDRGGLIGWHVCPAHATQGGVHPNHFCADGQIRFNAFMGGFYDTQGEARNGSCHEIGHAVGLRHHAPAYVSGETFASCMQPNIGDPNRIGLTGHDIEHIQVRYN